MIFRLCPILILSIIIYGCVTTSSFVPSERDGAATLTFVNKSGFEIKLGGYLKASDCSGGQLIFNDRKILDPAETTTVQINADEKFSFYYYSTKPRLLYYCRVPVTFSPRRNASYVATFDIIGFSAKFEPDAVMAESGIKIPPTDPNLGVTRFQQHNQGFPYAPTEVAPCYLSVARIENGKFVAEPSFVARKWRQPFMSNTEQQCY